MLLWCNRLGFAVQKDYILFLEILPIMQDPQQSPIKDEEPLFLTAAFYKFVDLPDYAARREPLLALCQTHQIKGIILLAPEGINSTICGKAEDIRAVLNYLRSDPAFKDLEHKESWTPIKPFRRMKVRLKKEIVTFGVPELNPNITTGTYVSAENWNALISDPNVMLIDTRNDYEVELGTFEGAVDPKIKKFTELANWVKTNPTLSGESNKGVKPKVAMFCTGGIRCEKSTAYMKSLGFDEVYHLQGGILKYLETIPRNESLWRGECFVFDERVTVDHSLKPGHYRLCRVCRQPITDASEKSAKFEHGVSCDHCFDLTTETQKIKARERERQCALAAKRSLSHIGDVL